MISYEDNFSLARRTEIDQPPFEAIDISTREPSGLRRSEFNNIDARDEQLANKLSDSNSGLPEELNGTEIEDNDGSGSRRQPHVILEESEE